MPTRPSPSPLIFAALCAVISGCKRDAASTPAPAPAVAPSATRPATAPATTSAAVAVSVLGLLPPGEYRAEALGLTESARCTELSAKMAFALGLDPNWTARYIREHAEPGKPLPYHRNFILSQAEYEELLALFEAQQLEVVDTFKLRIHREGDRLYLVALDERHRALDEVNIDLSTGALQSPAGPVPGPMPMPPDNKVRTFGPWPGIAWQSSSGSLETRYESVRLSVGRTPRTGHVLVEYTLDVASQGKRSRHERLMFRIPVK